MDQTTRVNPMPPAPMFGVAASPGDGGNGGMGGGGSKFINIDEIFADCFMDGDADILGLGGTGSQGGGGGGGIEGQGAGGVGGGGGGSGSGGGKAAGDQLGLNPNAAISASGGLHAGTFGMGSPAMMQAQQFQQQQQQQQQQLSSSPLGGMSMFLDRSAAGDLTGGTAGSPGGVQQGVTSASASASASGRGGRAGTAATGRGGALAAAKPKAKAAAAPTVAAASGGAGGRGRGRGRGKGGGQSGRGVAATKAGRGGGTAGARGAAAAAAAAMSMQSAAMSGMDDDDDDDDDEGMGGKRGAGKRPRQGGRNMTEQQRLDRRERNREHAKRSRVRKKFLLESLQKSVTSLQEENEKLRGAIRANLGAEEARELLSQTESSSLIASNPGDATKVLDDPDYSLVKALQTAQQNFVITDPTLPDNPIVFASQGFLELTGYTLDQVLGRNCRFLQGPDTDPKAVEKIRKAIEKGMDTSVCLRNYRVDGAMFWNQFFIAALRDSEGAVINYVGVQCKVDEDFVRAVQRTEGEDDADGEEEEEEEEEQSETEEKDAAG